MQRLKINYGEMWGHENYQFNPQDNYFINLFKQRFEVVIDPDPAIVIYAGKESSVSAFPRAKKLFYCCEVNGPSFLPLEHRSFDVSLSHFPEGGKNIFFPHFMIYINWFMQDRFRPLPSSPVYLLDLEDIHFGRMQAKKDKFCTLIANNPIKNRDDFFRALSAYKRVDSYGRLNNNTGGAVRFSELEKFHLLASYKFAIAFENGDIPNYTSEKTIHALACNAIPIYWGDGSAAKWLNEEKLISVNQFPSCEAVIDRIASLDNSDSEFERIMSLPALKVEAFYPLTPGVILDKVCNILNL